MTDAQEDIEVTITAEAKISMSDGSTRYAGKLPDVFAAENSGATVMLQKDVEMSPGLTEGIKIENGTFTLDLNGHNISSNDNAIVVSGENRPHLTISGSGTVSGVNSVQAILGILTLEGGTFIGGAYGYGVRAENQSVLSVTGENRSIENTSDDNYGLYIGGTQSAKLSAGTYDGIKAASTSTLADLLDKDTGCAYYRDGKPLACEGLGETTMSRTVLTGPVTVKECRHEGAESTSNNDGTHTLNCPYCGYTKQHATTLAATADTVANTVDRLQ